MKKLIMSSLLLSMIFTGASFAQDSVGDDGPAAGAVETFKDKVSVLKESIIHTESDYSINGNVGVNSGKRFKYLENLTQQSSDFIQQKLDEVIEEADASIQMDKELPQDINVHFTFKESTSLFRQIRTVEMKVNRGPYLMKSVKLRMRDNLVIGGHVKTFLSTDNFGGEGIHGEMKFSIRD